MTVDDAREWLEADGLGGFASGTASGVRTRRYHALLLSATTPPTGRYVLVNGLDAWLDAGSGGETLSTQRYAPNVLQPSGASRVVAFDHLPWPTWTFETSSGCRLTQEVCVEHGTGVVALSWHVIAAPGEVTLGVRPFLSGRDYHSLHRMNTAFAFDPTFAGGTITFSPYTDVPHIAIDSDGEYAHRPYWYQNFFYRCEQERGLDSVEDLAAPGEWTWRLRSGDRAIMLLRSSAGVPVPLSPEDIERRFHGIVHTERRRRDALGSPTSRAADAYLVSRGRGKTVIAGYPWFSDWGRDTFIALRGLCLATGRLADAREILLQWSGAVSEGMLPNRFTDSGEQPDFNSVDASLWFVVTAGELLERAADVPSLLTADQKAALDTAIERIVRGYSSGTRFGIRADDDGLLSCGLAGSQLTWMDARVGDRAVTPRVGKPVEVQALWLNALRVASLGNAEWTAMLELGRTTFLERFWNEDTGMLADVVDLNHIRGTRDNRCRPNQILAVGGLPMPLIDGPRAARIIDGVERQLLTPLGLRSLARSDPGYAGHYTGGAADRDAAYHQGTAWPWLLGPFVEAWVRIRGRSSEAKQEARTRFLQPLFEHLSAAGLGHVSEIADAEAPYTPRGCPFQAWSLGELIRLDREVLGPEG